MVNNWSVDGEKKKISKALRMILYIFNIIQ